MKLRRMAELCRELGIPRRTFQSWIMKDPELGVFIVGGKGGGSWWIKVDRLQGRLGGSLPDAYMLGSRRWIKATLLAKASGISRKTIANWCRDRPGFAKRLGHMYYVDLEEFGATPEQIEALLGSSGQNDPEEE